MRLYNDDWRYDYNTPKNVKNIEVTDGFITQYCGVPITEIRAAIQFLQKYKTSPTYIKLVKQMQDELAEQKRVERLAQLDEEQRRINEEREKLLKL